MGHDISLQLREGNLMTKIMLKQEEQVIEDLRDNKMDLTSPINQLGDTILHYAAYNSMKTLMEYLLSNHADPYCLNHRGLSPIDVAMPEVREWLIREWMKKKCPSDKTAHRSPKERNQLMLESGILSKRTLE